MTMYRKLILGSAASFLAMGAAQAADLPVKAKAVEYVRICSLYGSGFFYIPGTEPASSSAAICVSTPPSTAALTARPPGTVISASRTAFAITCFPVRAWR